MGGGAQASVLLNVGAVERDDAQRSLNRGPGGIGDLRRVEALLDIIEGDASHAAVDIDRAVGDNLARAREVP
ncbi:hypothetical protein ACFOEP_12725 [Microbacterium amylolyticum]|uniref:hypothetical protein n=1 Tax=Microbacterium amylolyticum TaxID=936337 RepID=UPI00360E58C8